MARTVRKSGMKEVPLSEVKDDLSRYLKEAEKEQIVITRHGKPAGVLIGFESEDEWFDFRPGLRTIPASSSASRAPAPTCARVAASSWKTSRPVNGLSRHRRRPGVFAIYA